MIFHWLNKMMLNNSWENNSLNMCDEKDIIFYYYLLPIFKNINTYSIYITIYCLGKLSLLSYYLDLNCWKGVFLLNISPGPLSLILPPNSYLGLIPLIPPLPPRPPLGLLCFSNLIRSSRLILLGSIFV